jgi:hypothetical protein
VLTIDVTATDQCANGVRFNRQVSTVLVPPGGGAQLSSPDGVVRVEVPAGRGGREALLLLATAADSRDGLEDAADAEVIETLGQPLGPSYEVLGANDLGIGGVALRFRLPAEVTPEDAGAVALYRKIDTGWVRVESWVDDADRSVVGSIEGDGVFRLILTGDRSVSPSLPKQVALYPSRPNPAPGRATILFDLPARSEATLRVYDATGRRVTTLVDRELPPGRHAFEWAGTDGSGRRVPSGVYFYELRAGQTTETRKLVLIR